MLGTYEHQRDNCEFPDCWQVCNDSCTPHFHSSVEIVYVIEGELKAVLNGRAYTVCASDVLISPSYTVHYYETETLCSSIVLTAPLDFVPSYQKILRKKTFAQNLFHDTDGEVLRCMNILSRRCSPGGIDNPGLVKGYIYVVLGLIAERVGFADIPNDRSLAHDILVYLQESYAAPVTLDAVARHFGYSRGRFSHIFSACFGCPLNEYVNNLRCRHAAALLTNSGATLIDAAMSSGFESLRTFYRSFKRCYGVTPTQYLDAYGAARAPGKAVPTTRPSRLCSTPCRPDGRDRQD